MPVHVLEGGNGPTVLKILTDDHGYQAFLRHAQKSLCVENVLFWKAIQDFKVCFQTLLVLTTLSCKLPFPR